MNKRESILVIALLTIWALSSMADRLMYFSLSDDTSSGGPLHNIAVLCLYLIELMAIIKLPICSSFFGRDKLGKSIIIWLTFAFVVTIINANEIFFDLRRLLWWPSIYFLFYLITLSNTRLIRVLIEYIFPFLFIGMSVLFVLSLIIRSSYLIQQFFVSNEIFFITLSLPLLSMIRNKTKRFTLLSVALVLSLCSFKRSAIIIGSLCFILILFDELKNQSFLRKLCLVSVFSIVGFVSYDYVNDITGGYISQRFEDTQETGGTGRTRIYSLVIKEYSESSIIDQVFGIGFSKVKEKYNIANEKDGRLYSAHNDFLEMLVDYGLIGLILYLVVLINYMRLIKQTKISTPANTGSAKVALCTFIVMSSVSHLYIYASFHAFIMVYYAIAKSCVDDINVYNQIQK